MAGCRGEGAPRAPCRGWPTRTRQYVDPVDAAGSSAFGPRLSLLLSSVRISPHGSSFRRRLRRRRGTEGHGRVVRREPDGTRGAHIPAHCRRRSSCARTARRMAAAPRGLRLVVVSSGADPRRSEATVRYHRIDAVSHGSVHAAWALGPGRHSRPMQAAPRDVERPARSAGPLPGGRVRRVAVRPESKELQQVRLHRGLDRDAGTGPLALRGRARRARGGTPRRGRPSSLPDLPPHGATSSMAAWWSPSRGPADSPTPSQRSSPLS